MIIGASAGTQTSASNGAQMEPEHGAGQQSGQKPSQPLANVPALNNGTPQPAARQVRLQGPLKPKDIVYLEGFLAPCIFCLCFLVCCSEGLLLPFDLRFFFCIFFAFFKQSQHAAPELVAGPVHS